MPEWFAFVYVIGSVMLATVAGVVTWRLCRGYPPRRGVLGMPNPPPPPPELGEGTMHKGGVNDGPTVPRPPGLTGVQ